jgi:hypothetical protein
MAREAGFSDCFSGDSQGFFFVVGKSTELLEVYPEL